MIVLAMDTATPAVRAAVASEAGRLSEAGTTGVVRHGELLAPMVELALERAGVGVADLTAIGVGTGPGPFTGLRVGLVHARVMGLALGRPVYGVCTLDVLAEQVRHTHGEALGEGFLVLTDARRREVYWARYDARAVRCEGPHVGPAATIPHRHELPAFGSGALLYASELAAVSPPEYPDPSVLAAMVIARMARGEAASTPQPLYLRRPDATPNPTVKKVLA